MTAKLTMKSTVSLLFSLLMISCGQQQHVKQEVDEATLKKEVWKAVETRFNTWRDNDYEGHMAVYHPDWRRWSPDSLFLMKKEDFTGLWDMMKSEEQLVDLELEPVEIMLYNNGNMAIAHFVSTESFVWTGDQKTDDKGRRIERGSLQTVIMRWSDVMVKEDGRWLYVGGHRDFGMPFLEE
jgi:hypothetical protein